MVMLCFTNLNSSSEVFWGDMRLESAILDGSATFLIRLMLQRSNRIEIRWKSTDLNQVLELPERFSAWLEIVETSAS